MKKEEKLKKSEAERDEQEKQQKAMEEELILNEKEQLRLDLERAEEGSVQHEASEGRNEVIPMEEQRTHEDNEEVE